MVGFALLQGPVTKEALAKRRDKSCRLQDERSLTENWLWGRGCSSVVEQVLEMCSSVLASLLWL